MYELRYLFFFFKQKTAYDMRISDWSSDVCSPDLHAGRAQAEAHAGLAAIIHQVAEAHLGAYPRHRPHEIFDHPVRVGMVDVEAEIGRASCRERVCKYV